MKECPSCGYEMTDEIEECPYCGHKFDVPKGLKKKPLFQSSQPIQANGKVSDVPDGPATFALVAGIFSIATSFSSFSIFGALFPIVFGIIAIRLGKKHGNEYQRAKVGSILGLFGIFVSLCCLLLMIIIVLTNK